MTAFVSNAGLVLLAPYLPVLFKRLSLTEGDLFVNQDTRVRAMLVIEYAIHGRTKFEQHELPLNKVLVAANIDISIPNVIELTEDEKYVVDCMLMAVINNWDKMKNTSVDGLRESFLVREGKMEEHDDFYKLTVERKAYDVLLSTLPWSFNIIQLKWMKKAIHVKWM